PEVHRIDIVGSAVAAVGEYQAALQRRQSRHLQRRGHVRIDKALAVVALSTRQGQLIAQAEVDGKPAVEAKVVLHIPGVSEVLRGGRDIDAISVSALREADQ